MPSRRHWIGQKAEIAAVRSAAERFYRERFKAELESMDVELLAAYQGAADADETECRAHFRENAAQYYAALGQYCKHLNTEEMPDTGLSKEQLKAIEAQQIDLKYLNATLGDYQTFGVKYAIHQKRKAPGSRKWSGKNSSACWNRKKWNRNLRYLQPLQILQRLFPALGHAHLTVVPR